MSIDEEFGELEELDVDENWMDNQVIVETVKEEDKSIPKSLDITEFGIDIKDNEAIKTNIVIIGVGATGSSFMLLLAHLLKYTNRYHVTIYDHDYIENHNNAVSMYGFMSRMRIDYRNAGSKAIASKRLLRQLIGMGNNIPIREVNFHTIKSNNTRVDKSILDVLHERIDYIFVFTDNNLSRYEVAKYHLEHPDTIILDCRVGTYDQFEVYFSNSPSKYMQTIYFDDDEKTKPSKIVTNNVCLDDRMNFSIAMTSSSLLMNMFTQHLKGDMKQDFKHIMIGRDYIGEVKGYD